MVTIRYFKQATSKQFETHWVKNVGVFLQDKDFTTVELLDLRFFHNSIMGNEISTEGGDFLGIF